MNISITEEFPVKGIKDLRGSRTRMQQCKCERMKGKTKQTYDSYTVYSVNEQHREEKSNDLYIPPLSITYNISTQLS